MVKIVFPAKVQKFFLLQKMIYLCIEIKNLHRNKK